MTMHAKRIARRATALLIAVILVVPTTALAVGGAASHGGKTAPVYDMTATQSGPGDPSGDAPTTERTMTGTRSSGSTDQERVVQNRSGLSEQRKQQMKKRVRDRLRTRKERFDRASRILAERIERVRQIAARAEANGADVSRVYALLDQSSALLAEAQALEAEAVALFNSIADADDPRAAFEAARNKAIEAVKALRDARQKLGQAIVVLTGILGELIEGE